MFTDKAIVGAMTFSLPPKSLLSFGKKHCIAAMLRFTHQLSGALQRGRECGPSFEMLKTYIHILEHHEIPSLSTLALQLKKSLPVCARSLALFRALLEREYEREEEWDGPSITTIDRAKKRASFPEKIDLVLDNVRSCFNVGCLFRTAEALDVRKIYLCGYTATPENPKLAKSSLGSEQWVQWEYYANTLDCLSILKGEHCSLYALETADAAGDLRTFRPTFPCALILGNERFGLGTPVLKMADEILTIPLYGRKNSLNVAVTGPIALYQFRHFSR